MKKEEEDETEAHRTEAQMHPPLPAPPRLKTPSPVVMELCHPCSPRICLQMTHSTQCMGANPFLPKSYWHREASPYTMMTGEIPLQHLKKGLLLKKRKKLQLKRRGGKIGRRSVGRRGKGHAGDVGTEEVRTLLWSTRIRIRNRVLPVLGLLVRLRLRAACQVVYPHANCRPYS
ncbi:hypothetical protein BGW80DRAFT_917281 [Lactifluus volemus]|nr:hypothetical protein BGW80DRAFT_917281 [Lactifluus volemus]